MDVMTVSSLRSMSRCGNLEHAKCVVSDLYRFKFTKIHFLTHEPCLSDIPMPEYDWATSVYGKSKEVITQDMLEAVGRPVVTLT